MAHYMEIWKLGVVVAYVHVGHKRCVTVATIEEPKQCFETGWLCP